jgi:beta-glucanase (GH16 family)
LRVLAVALSVETEAYFRTGNLFEKSITSFCNIVREKHKEVTMSVHSMTIKALIIALIGLLIFSNETANRLSHAQLRQPENADRSQPLKLVDPNSANAMPRIAAPPNDNSNWNLIFSDEFHSASLDTAKWGTCQYWTLNDNGCVGGLGEIGWFRPENAYTESGVLRLRAEKKTYINPEGRVFNYTAGAATTRDKYAFTYGFLEAKIKVPKGQGLWSQFWAHPATRNGNVVWPPEIDAVEIVSNDTHVAHMTLHYLKNGIHLSKGFSYPGSVDFSTGWHTFAFDWQPDKIIWYIDGVERFRTTDNTPNVPMNIIASLAVGGDWPGNPDETTSFPSYMDVDYIRVWQRGASSTPVPPILGVHKTFLPVVSRPNETPPTSTATATPSSSSTINIKVRRFENNQWFEPLQGWTIKVYQNQIGSSEKLVRQLKTDSNGAALVGGLEPSHYRICEDVKPGWRNTFAGGQDGSGNYCHWLTLTNGIVAQLNFGNAPIPATQTATATTRTASTSTSQPPTASAQPSSTSTPQQPTSTTIPPTTTSEPASTSTSQPPTATASPTPTTVSPTSTPLAPTSTSQPASTSTPAPPTATVSPSPSITPSATQIVLPTDTPTLSPTSTFAPTLTTTSTPTFTPTP